MANPVVEAARERAAEPEDDIVTLSTGVRARILYVSPSLIAEVTARVKNPPPPVFMKGDREIENPDHPDYRRACEEKDLERGIAAMNAMAMFGIELVDGVPKDNAWVAKLHYLGIEFEGDDPVERELFYKKHIALGATDWNLISSKSGVSREAIRQAEETFQRSA